MWAVKTTEPSGQSRFHYAENRAPDEEAVDWVNTIHSSRMMQEILSLLSTFRSSDEEPANDEGLDAEVASPPVEMLPPIDPLPLPSDSDRIREPTPEQYAELKKKLRAKLASRRYTRRRKADTKAQADLLRQEQGRRSRLQAIAANVLNASTTRDDRVRDAELLESELGILTQEARSTAGQTRDLFDQVERMVHSHTSDQVEVVRPDRLSGIRTVRDNWSQSDQLSRAIANLRVITTVLSDSQHQSSSEFSLSAFNGWRVIEWSQRGPRYCVQASKLITTISRHALSANVWENADDENKRIAMCAYYTRFVVLTSKNQLRNDKSCVFYSEELHEFPPPFQCRVFTSLNGAHNDEDQWYYVKHSIHGQEPRGEGQSGDEIVGVILQDASDGNGAAGGVHVDLVLYYDTRSVCHAKQIVCEDPPVSHRVLSDWERNHGVPDG